MESVGGGCVILFCGVWGVYRECLRSEGVWRTCEQILWGEFVCVWGFCGVGLGLFAECLICAWGVVR